MNEIRVKQMLLAGITMFLVWVVAEILLGWITRLGAYPKRYTFWVQGWLQGRRGERRVRSHTLSNVALRLYLVRVLP